MTCERFASGNDILLVADNKRVSNYTTTTRHDVREGSQAEERDQTREGSQAEERETKLEKVVKPKRDRPNRGRRPSPKRKAMSINKWAEVWRLLGDLHTFGWNYCSPELQRIGQLLKEAPVSQDTRNDYQQLQDKFHNELFPFITRLGSVVSRVTIAELTEEEMTELGQLTTTKEVDELARQTASDMERRLTKRLRAIEAKRAELEKFVMVLSHELRTPIHGLLGQIQIMRSKIEKMPLEVGDVGTMERLVHECCISGNPQPLHDLIRATYTVPEYGGPAEMVPRLRNMESTALLMNSMVEDILDYTRATTGRGAELAKDDVDISELLTETLDLVKIADGRGDKFDSAAVCYASAKGTFIVDRSRLSSVLINLLNNAFRATLQGNVTITAKEVPGEQLLQPGKSGHRICFEIKDTGCGMSQEMMANLMETPFATNYSNNLQNATRGMRSTGLGFGIVRHVVEQLLQGKLDVSSKVGKGTTFRVFLDLQKASEASSSTSSSLCVSNNNHTQEFTQYPILVVDDEVTNREVLVGLLEACGQKAHVDIASSGTEALEKIIIRHEEHESPYKLVFMDVNMPELQGDDATAYLRACEQSTPTAPRTRVYGLSAFDIPETKNRCMRKGMDGYCTKPLKIFDLQKIINSLHTDESITELENIYLDSNDHSSRGSSVHGGDAWEHPIPETGTRTISDAVDANLSTLPNVSPVPIREMMNAARQKGPLCVKILTSDVSLPAELALIDTEICDLPIAWKNGLRKIEVYHTLARAVCAFTPVEMEIYRATKDWKALHDEAHRILGICRNLHAYHAVNALENVEELTVDPFAYIEDGKVKEKLVIVGVELVRLQIVLRPLIKS